MRFKKKLDFERVYNRFNAKAKKALLASAHAVRADVVNSKTIPLESGHLQNNATNVDATNLRNNVVWVYSSTVYARRKYFNPEFEFDRSINTFASGRWFDPYIIGDRRDYAFRFYCEKFRESPIG